MLRDALRAFVIVLTLLILAATVDNRDAERSVAEAPQ